MKPRPNKPMTTDDIIIARYLLRKHEIRDTKPHDEAFLEMAMMMTGLGVTLTVIVLILVWG